VLVLGQENFGSGTGFTMVLAYYFGSSGEGRM
jgi:hypothetical protein